MYPWIETDEKKQTILLNSWIFKNRINYFWNKLPNQIKSSQKVENFEIKLDNFRKKEKKEVLRGNFYEQSVKCKQNLICM